MRIDRFTNQLQSALADAQSLAVGQDHTAIEPAHLLSSLLTQQGGAVRPMLAQAGFNLASIERAIRFGFLRKVYAILSTQLLLTFSLYGCEFYLQNQGALQQKELLLSWGWSIVQRFLINEPFLICFSKGVPMLYLPRDSNI